MFSTVETDIWEFFFFTVADNQNSQTNHFHGEWPIHIDTCDIKIINK